MTQVDQTVIVSATRHDVIRKSFSRRRIERTLDENTTGVTMTDFPSAFNDHNHHSSSGSVSLALSDEGFLLRSTLYYDWGAVLDRCGLLAELFSTSVRDRDEELHRRLKSQGRRQLTATDQWNNGVLHAACFNRAPLEVIHAILDVASAAEPPVCLTQLRHSDESTPLLVACAMGSVPSVIQALLQHDSVLSNSLPKVLGIARAPDTLGSTPLTELCNHYQRLDRRNRRSLPPLELVDLVLNNNQDFSRDFQHFWSNVAAIVRAGWRRDNNESMPSLLHGCCHMAESCPPALTDLICRNYPHMISSTDRNGVLPIHLAVRGTFHPSQTLRYRQAYMIRRLCDSYPQACTEKIHGGRSVFCTAIASGLSWSEEHSPDQTTTTGPLQRIWKCVPDAIDIPDQETGLFPFLLAATVAGDPSWDEKEKETASARCVDNVFGLLRIFPQVVNDLTVVNDDWVHFE